MSEAKKLLQVAASQIGTREWPPESNRVKYTKWYGLIGPWCAMFVSWCARSAGISTKTIPTYVFTPTGALWFKWRRQWHKSNPQVGDIAFFDLAGLGRISHTGIVEHVHGDGSVTTIEGNTDERGGRTGGKVMRKSRKDLGPRGGYGRPKYAKAPWVAPKHRPTDVNPKAKGRLVVDGDLGPKTVARWRQVTDAPQGTRMTYGFVKHVQRGLNLWGHGKGRTMLKVDGDLGPKTCAALRARTGCPASPTGTAMTKTTVRYLQSWLNAHTRSK